MKDSRAYQQQAFWAVKKLRRYLLMWLRQGGKTTTLADQSFMEMAEFPGRLITFVSASLNIGSEFVEKEAKAFHSMLAELRAQAEAHHQKLAVGYRPNADSDHDDNFRGLPDDVDWEAMAGLLEQSKLELRLRHSETVCSRTKIIAANIATARSWSGSVKFDEVAFVRDLKTFLAEIEPIFATDPTFNLIMATTPPPDYAHYAYELLTDENGREEWPLSPEGHWFKNRAGIWVHRVTIDDAAAAGRKTYDPDTGAEQSPDENRAASLDKDGWDRSNRLTRPTIGTSAVSPMALDAAQKRGQGRAFAGEWLAELGDAFPSGYLDHFASGDEVSLGLDLASTEGKKSNPSALAVSTKRGGVLRIPALTWWKTSNEVLTERRVVETAIALRRMNVKVRVVNIDATNERLFASRLAKILRAMGIRARLCVGGESVQFRGETVALKALTGNLLAHEITEGGAVLPFHRYTYDDFMRVTRAAGSFTCTVGPAGEHGDTFDAAKLANFGWTTSGPVQAEAAGIGHGGKFAREDDEDDDTPKGLLGWLGKGLGF